jgi:1-acyl-sn-glycerol-3-phosphate acyltransferase
VRPPPVWIRRLLIAPLVVALAVGLLVTVPVWALVMLAVSPLLPGKLRPLRVLWLVTVYLLVEAVLLVSLAALWVASGFGGKIRGVGFQRAHYRLCGAALAVLYRAASRVLKLTVRITGSAPDALADRPLIVLCRHAGPGDSFLIAHTLINVYRREPRIVLKAALQWDPAIDVLLNRLPNVFIVPRQRAEAPERIAALAADLDADDALVIFPEGGNFTPERWIRAIARLRRMGLHKMAARAERMTHVLPPQPGGVLAALAASPRAAVVLVGHTGVDHLLTAGDVWRELPMDKTIVMRWWLEDPAGVPAADDARIDWLYRWWARIDTWIDEQRVNATAE